MKLATGRIQLATTIEAAIDAAALPYHVGVLDNIPDSVAPPIVWVSWADPWLNPTTYCNYEAAMEATIVAQRLEPGGNVERLEEIVEAIVPAIRALTGYVVKDVTSPYPLNVAGVDYLAATVSITYDIGD